jgi:hypothetical protein
MAPPLKPSGPYIEQRDPDSYSYELTGARWGQASMNPQSTELTVSARSSKNAWDSVVRVRVTTSNGNLVCDPSKSTALLDDAGAPWGSVVVEAGHVQVKDRDGVVRVEVTKLSGKPRDGSAVLGGAFEVRILDADGFAVARRPTFTP